MLSLEYLLEEAEGTGLPVSKRRAILREYLQTILLNGIYKSRMGNKLYFVGGTALRFCYRLPRFSEDLDFNSEKLSFRDFKTISEKAIKNLKLEGFEVKGDYRQRKGLYIAELTFPEVMKQYGIMDQRGVSMMIKLEVNQPEWPLKTQTHALSFYGLSYMAKVMAESSFITEKLCAMLSRSRGRDIYDLLFMLRKKFPFDRKILEINGFSKSPQEHILQHLEGLGEKEIKRIALQVKPFLFKEDEIVLVINALEYAKKFLESY